jgi:hypothetical protein
MAKKKRSGLKIGKNNFEIHQVAHYLFLLGLLIAVLSGGWFSLVLNGSCLANRVINPAGLISALVVLGLIVGLINLTAKETIPFLVAAIALMLAGIVNLGLIPVIGNCLRSSLSNIVVFVVPGAIIVGLKTIWRLASD